VPNDFHEYLEELEKAFQSGGVAECRKFMEEKRDGWKSIPLNVAVTGNSGVGKSSFINAIRGLTADDEGGDVENITPAILFTARQHSLLHTYIHT